MRIGIVGLGLIGGSLAGALRHAGNEVVGCDTSQDAEDIAVERGYVDAVQGFESLASNVDMLILCTPVGETLRTIPASARFMKPDAIMTDVASVKRPVLDAMNSVPRPFRCVGGHPVAGKETSGVRSADPAIFRGAPYAIVPGAVTSQRSIDVLTDLAIGIGARPVQIDAAAHDSVVARMSHLPQVLSSALSISVDDGRDKALAGTGLQSMLRLAGSDEKLWADILAYNHDNVSAAIRDFLEVLEPFAGSIAAGDTESIGNSIRRGREARK